MYISKSDDNKRINGKDSKQLSSIGCKYLIV